MSQVIRESLIANLFKKYNELVIFLKEIPVNQNNQLTLEAYKMIDIGIICFEKVINHSEIKIPEPEVKILETEAEPTNQQ